MYLKRRVIMKILDIVEDVVEEANKSNILELKELSPHVQYILWRKQPKPPNIICSP